MPQPVICDVFEVEPFSFKIHCESSFQFSFCSLEDGSLGRENLLFFYLSRIHYMPFILLVLFDIVI